MSSTPDSSASDGESTAHTGDDFLAANRAKREKIRAEEAEKAEKAEKSTSVDEAVDDPVGPADKLAGASGGRRFDALTMSLIAAVVVLAVTTGVFVYLAFGTSDESDDLDRAGAMRDAKSYAAQMFTYEYGKYDDLDRRIRAVSTPEFADFYIKSSQQARAANDAAQASSKGSAEKAGVVSISDDEAVVLVALDNTVTSPQAPALGAGNGAYQSRVEVTLKRGDDGRWLLSDFDVV